MHVTSVPQNYLNRQRHSMTKNIQISIKDGVYLEWPWRTVNLCLTELQQLLRLIFKWTNGKPEHFQEHLLNSYNRFPDGVIGIFHWHNSSGHTMALGLTQPLTEISTRNISWGKRGRCVGLTTLSPSFADCLGNMGASTSWNSQGLSRPVMGLLYLLPTIVTAL